MDLQIGSTIDHDHYGKGKVLDEQELFWTIDFGKKGIIEITKRNADMLTLLALPRENENNNSYTMEELEKTLRRVLEDYSDISENIELGGKWEGGTMILQPADASQKSKDIPIETFFHKIETLFLERIGGHIIQAINQ